MRFSRNIGLIDEAQQARLAGATVAVCGTGGMGGVCTEVLGRMGVGHLILADHDRFELSNVNRQIHANDDTMGKNKAEVLAAELRRINPDVRVDVYPEGVRPETVDALVDPADVLVNGMDQMRSSLLMERTARERGKTIVDAWLTPFASVFVMQPDSPHWESYLDLPTRGVPLDDLSDELCRSAVAKEVEYTFSFGDPYRYIDGEVVDEVVAERRPRPSLAPMVWLAGVLMANEVFKFLVGLPVTDHVGIVYDQYEHRLLERRPRDG